MLLALALGASDAVGISRPASFDMVDRDAETRRGDRPVTIATAPPPRERVIRVSTVTREGTTRVVRKKPFGFAAAPLGVAAPDIDYERFDPLSVFSTSGDDRLSDAFATIYDADVESEVTLRHVPFDAGVSFHPGTGSTPSAMGEVLAARSRLNDAKRTLASLATVSPTGGSTSDETSAPPTADEAIAKATDMSAPADAPEGSVATLAYAASSGGDAYSLNRLGAASREAADDVIRMSAPAQPQASSFARDYPELEAAALSAVLSLGAQNVSRVERSENDAWAAPVSREVVVTLKTDESLLKALGGGLRSYGTHTALAHGVVSRLAPLIGEGGGELVVRLAWRAPGDDVPAQQRDVRRISVYRGGEHLVTVVRDDGGRVVDAPAPATIEIDARERRKREVALARSMPTIYDGVMRAALSQGMTPDHARRLVRIMAFDVDFRAKASPEDRLEVFYSLAEGFERPTDESKILYAAATINGVTRRYYRYARTKADGETVTDFYDEAGRSAKKFLLRRPVPNGRFTSGYGMRRHPIARYRKMHTGVDWAAPSGTPILSAGSGTVIKRGWAGGYGRQIKIRHANGYVTSYSHLRRFARGLKVGSRVRQGQRIGQVGTSGASTGPHLHYEVAVNGRRVNPMRIRLPQGDTLTDGALVAFKRERDRIDALVERGRGNVEVASR